VGESAPGHVAAASGGPEAPQDVGVAAQPAVARFTLDARLQPWEDAILFHVTWEFIDSTEAGQKRSLDLFSKWQPGPGKFQGFYGFADGGGGAALIEADTAADLAKTTMPWTPFLKFTARVILPIQESAAISGEAAAWRDKH
jgi:Domain of unknown function (DUF3303)